MNIQTIVILPLTLGLLVACSPATEVPPTPAPTEAQAQLPEATAVPAATTALTQPPADDERQSDPTVTIDLNGLAQGFTSQIIPAVSPGTDRPWWEVMPQHTAVALQGYPISDNRIHPQILIFPVEGLKISDYTGRATEELQALLQNRRIGQSMPFLPAYNEKQILFAQLKNLDFKNGTGVRFLTEYNQGPTPVNNRGLLYTFQGLTSDARYYLAVVLPVHFAGLPADETTTEGLPDDYLENYDHYIADMVETLDQASAGDYTPDLGALDALVRSIEVN